VNSKQRIAVFIGAALIALVIVFHAPWTGYIKAQAYMTQLPVPTSTGIVAVEQSSPLPFTSWHTAQPLVEWLGSWVAAITLIGLIVGLVGLWCFLNRSQALAGNSK
jgi:hypothetical protein